MDMELTAELLVDAPQLADVHLSPDGRRATYVVKKGTRSAIWVNGDRFSWGEGADDHPRWSPDGRALAFRSDRAGKPQIFLLPAAGGGEARQLTDDPSGVQAFAWSPAAGILAFTSPDPQEPPDPFVEGERRPSAACAGWPPTPARSRPYSRSHATSARLRGRPMAATRPLSPVPHPTSEPDRISGSRPATLRNSLSPCTAPSIHLAHTS